MPHLSIEVSGDGMGAKLRIAAFDQEEWKAGFSASSGLAGERRLRAYLESQGIAAKCIRDEVLRWISETLSCATPSSLAADLESAQEVDVAQGVAPAHDEPQGLVFHHAYLSNAEAIADLRRKADTWGFEGLRDHIDPAYWVASGETVLSFRDVSQAPSWLRRFRRAGSRPKPARAAAPLRQVAVLKGKESHRGLRGRAHRRGRPTQGTRVG
jgi:hypothetical protein